MPYEQKEFQTTHGTRTAYRSDDTSGLWACISSYCRAETLELLAPLVEEEYSAPREPWDGGMAWTRMLDLVFGVD